MSGTKTVAITDEQLVADMRHFVCCDLGDAPGDPTVTLCGLPDKWDGGYTDDCECHVCRDLDALDVCPVQGKCPWGDA